MGRRGGTWTWALFLPWLIAAAPAPARADWLGLLADDAAEAAPTPQPGDAPDNAPADWAHARADRRQPFTLNLYVENDSPYFKPNHDTDRYYTNGIAVGLSHRPQWADDIAPYMPFAEAFGPARTGAGYQVGQLIFTPEDLTRRDLIKDDRPYAGYLFASVYWQRANDTTLDHFQVEVGLTGPLSLAADAQKFVHNTFNDTDPQGWGNQIEDELQFQTYLRKKWKADHAFPSCHVAGHPLTLQVIPELGLALGTVYRHVEGGGVLRLGFNLLDDFGPGRLADVGDATAGPPTQGWGAFVFGRATGRLVEHNVFIEGNNYRDSFGLDENRLVGELQAGLGLRYTRNAFSFDVTYSQTYQTQEFEIQRGTHAFAAWTLAVTWAF